MSSIFDVMTRDEWVESGAGAQAQKGEYASILKDFADSGARFAKISTAADGNGRFAGKQASQVATSLKQARDAKTPPEGVGEHIRVSSKEGTVYLENTEVEA